MSKPNKEKGLMASAMDMRQLLEAGVHFGHQTSRWNPRMREYIFGARNGVHIIDLEQTISCMESACTFAHEVIASGKQILFVGTKKQAQGPIDDVCTKTGQPFVTHRWMGGMLTNFGVIQQRLRQMADLREMRERGDFQRMSGKEANDNKDELAKLEENFGGMAGVKGMPGAVFIVDCKKERLAVAEALKVKIPIIAIADTNCDPGPISYPIPGNDDAIRSIKLITETLGEAIEAGLQAVSDRKIASATAEAAAALAAEEAKAKEEPNEELAKTDAVKEPVDA
jgi:small subunit ribosomal protein S2